MPLTSIEWTNRTWNPIRGCSRVSEGCRNCYAVRIAARFSGPQIKGATIKRELVSEPFYLFATQNPPHWTGKVELIESKLDEPLHWRKPQRVFVNSMSDLFHEALPFTVIKRVFDVMVLAPQHEYQILTKRAQRLREFSEWYAMQTADPIPAHIDLGVSVEDQPNADIRIPELLKAVTRGRRFVSYEPALGPVGFASLPGLDWLIVGGESGPGARPFDLAWMRSARDQCAATGVAFFPKQLGSKPIENGKPLLIEDSKGGDESEWPSDLYGLRTFPR